jgi:hypothetical protein
VTPAWRSRETGADPAAETYEAPRVEEHTPVGSPLNTIPRNSIGLPDHIVPTPKWRTKGDGR